MKKWVNLLAVSALSTFVITGCGNGGDGDQAETPTSTVESTVSETASTTASNQEEMVSVNVSVQEDGELIPGTDKELEVAEESNLLDVMKENYDVEESNTFINSIEGISQDEEEGKYWMFDVNGEAAPVGAADTIVKDGDEVVWDLSGM